MMLSTVLFVTDLVKLVVFCVLCSHRSDGLCVTQSKTYHFS